MFEPISDDFLPYLEVEAGENEGDPPKDPFGTDKIKNDEDFVIYNNILVGANDIVLN
jgi:hypothetical protein